ncbi:sigma-70 family RNA polymerase sigma factor [Radiobacillus kanasensis]|uniref:sigma-70 family RNA polymerase sigma factor n=1 Tax=Radiobacillus kanasensis TaxID=2844358 RepID=UPI001E5F9753|nr:sigma-70 family RNA polymerase sigma factor [Radiobacillus kanasensis]UFT98776.1 sigma-70 family RNA polymerase sigma factor [Radiobacillus kanasensis]
MRTDNFNGILEKYENMIFYLIHKLGIRDPNNEFYQKGVIALWKAIDSYDPERGKFSSYAYFLIEKALIGLIRKKQRTIDKEAYFRNSVQPDSLVTNIELSIDPYVIEKIKNKLTYGQWKWFNLYVLQDLSVKDIATRENVSIDAVKNWGRRAKPKLKKLLK